VTYPDEGLFTSHADTCSAMAETKATDCPGRYMPIASIRRACAQMVAADNSFKPMQCGSRSPVRNSWPPAGKRGALRRVLPNDTFSRQ